MSDQPCPFCDPRPAERIFYEDELTRGLWDGFPVSPGHALIVPRRHVATWFDATAEEPEGEGSGYQTTTMSYDGHGRLHTRHVPGQEAGRSTAYAYRPDDTLESVTDARGVKAVYGYRYNRHLVTSVDYDLTGVIAGQNVADTPGVTYDYDAAGNRTRMTDGPGQATSRRYCAAAGRGCLLWDV